MLVQLSLSTATPSVGGTPPELNTSKVRFVSAPRIRSVSSISLSMSSAPPPPAKMQLATTQSSSFARKLDSPSSDDLIRLEDSRVPMAVLTTTASEGASSSTFTIPRPATIASDNKPHKVTITVVEDLKARFTYTLVPSKSLNAFLKASCTNTTKEYPFLAGPINVFMDGNFVTNSSLKQVSPKEEFALFLGVDAAVKVDFKPVKELKETKGMVVGKTNIQTFERKTVIKNTKSIEVAVTVYDQLPLSDDEKIKVKLVEPVLKDYKETELTLNPNNNLEWRIRIKPGEKTELPFSYSIEWPRDREIEFA